jgi:transposase-like protein
MIVCPKCLKKSNIELIGGINSFVCHECKCFFRIKIVYDIINELDSYDQQYSRTLKSTEDSSEDI